MLVPVENAQIRGLQDIDATFINTDMIVTISVNDAGNYKWCQITMINGVKLNLTMESFEKIMDAMIKNEKMA